MRATYCARRSRVRAAPVEAWAVLLGLARVVHVSNVDLLGHKLPALRTRDSLKVRLQGERTVAGSDPRSPKGFWRDPRA